MGGFLRARLVASGICSCKVLENDLAMMLLRLVWQVESVAHRHQPLKENSGGW